MQLDLFYTEQPPLVKESLLCRKCNKDKPLSSFNACAVEWETQKREKGVRGVTGTARYCRECREDYARSTAIARKQAPPRPEGLTECSCCKNILEGSLTQLDHDHATGQFRGWLCRACNTGMGALGDTIEGLEKALAYLKRHSDERP